MGSHGAQVHESARPRHPRGAESRRPPHTRACNGRDGFAGGLDAASGVEPHADHIDIDGNAFRHLDRQGKRDFLAVLSDAVWDLEAQLAHVKLQRAALMSSLQDDVRGRRRT